MFARSFDRSRASSMSKTVAERYDIKVHIRDQAGSYTDTDVVTLASPEVYVNMGMSEEEAEDVVLYVAGHEGAHVMLSDINAIKVDFTEALSKGREQEKLNNLMQIIEDARVDTLTTRIRPGYADFRDRACTLLNTACGETAPTGDVAQDLFMALSDATYGHNIADINPSHKDEWERAVNLKRVYLMNEQIDALISAPGSTSHDSVKLAVKFYDEIFKFTPPDEKSKTKGGGTGDSKDDETVADSDEKSEGRPEESPEEYGEADGIGTAKGSSSKSDKEETGASSTSKDSSEESSEEAYKDEEGGTSSMPGGSPTHVDVVSEREIDEAIADMLSKMPSKLIMPEPLQDAIIAAKNKEEDLRMALVSPKSYIDNLMRNHDKVLSPAEDAELIKTVSSDTHAGVPVNYITPSKTLPQDPAALRYRLNDAITTSKVRGLDGQIAVLANRLMADLRASKDPQAYVGDSGRIRSRDVWKTKTGDDKIFDKASYEDEGEFVVDILLDSSGSQSGREHDIRVQAYIMAEALSIAKIPFQITEFSNSSAGTNLVQLVGYDAPRDHNLKTMLFIPNGDNRDGHAIKTIGYLIKRRPEQHKIIIVLSDGQPSDTYSSKYQAVETFGGMARYHMRQVDKVHNITSVDDAARIVRQLRADGIQLLGVFTGEAYYNKETLEVERTIYGTDFAFIPNINDFVAVVSNYLHKQILKALE